MFWTHFGTEDGHRPATGYFVCSKVAPQGNFALHSSKTPRPWGVCHCLFRPPVFRSSPVDERPAHATTNPCACGIGAWLCRVRVVTAGQPMDRESPIDSVVVPRRLRVLSKIAFIRSAFIAVGNNVRYLSTMACETRQSYTYFCARSYDAYACSS
jgi:hypothetical protein